MKHIKPQLPTGMRDYLPADMLRRQYVIDKVTDVFEAFGYEPLQTPVMELSETLKGKYGDDAERLIYYAYHPGGKEELALRYDLTVPLARVVGMHESRLQLPFRRYQIAPVWRGERPQRGRFREFYQCDVDLVGSASMLADAEMVSLVAVVMQRLGFDDFSVRLNNRKLLTGIGQYAGLSGQPLADLYRSIDKLDKIGMDGVRDELIRSGIDTAAIVRIMDVLALAYQRQQSGYDAGAALIGALREMLEDIPAAEAGLQELEDLLDCCAAMNVPEQFIALDLTCVRGLGYYTGSTFETVLLSNDPEERVGSVSGGGRYDDLVGLFRKEPLPTVGVSLGIERLITLMDKRNLYPSDINRTVVQVLVTLFGPETQAETLGLASTLRDAGIRTELYTEPAKLGKQIGYADKRGIPVVVLLGPSELEQGVVKIKLLRQQQEIVIQRASIVETLTRLLGSPGAQAG